MQTDAKIEDKLNAIVKRIACPLNAACLSGNEILCTAKINLAKGALTKGVSLGDIEEDIIANCQSCKLKNFSDKDIKDVYVEGKVNKEGDLACFATGKVICHDTCAGCAFLNVKKTVEFFEGLPEGNKVERIACGYPRITPERAKIFLTKEEKKLKRPD